MEVWDVAKMILVVSYGTACYLVGLWIGGQR